MHALPAGTTARVENKAAAVARWAAGLPADALVVFEATGGCDAPLAACGVRFARVNPRPAREFARALGVQAKTDKVDARELAEMGPRLPIETGTDACSPTSSGGASSWSGPARPRRTTATAPGRPREARPPPP